MADDPGSETADGNNKAENPLTIYTEYTKYLPFNLRGKEDKVILISAKRSEHIHKASQVFAQNLGIDHQQLVDLAEAYFIHKFDKQVQFRGNDENSDSDRPVYAVKPKITSEMEATITAELVEIKQTLKNQICRINSIVSSWKDRQPDHLLEEWRQALYKKLTKTRKFLKDTRLQDPELMQLIKDAGKALETSGKLLEKTKQHQTEIAGGTRNRVS